MYVTAHNWIRTAQIRAYGEAASLRSRREGPRRAAEGGRPGAGGAAGREEATHVTKEDRGGTERKGNQQARY